MPIEIDRETTNLAIRGKPLVAFRFHASTPGERVQSEFLVDRVKQLLTNNPTKKAYICILVPGLNQWRSLPAVVAGQDFNISFNAARYEMIDLGAGDEIENFEEALVLVGDIGDRAGGCKLGAAAVHDSANDCLFRAIQQGFGGLLPKDIGVYTDEHLRLRLGLAARTPISVDEFVNLEKIWPRVAFTCKGETPAHSYDSGAAATRHRCISVSLSNGHYTLLRHEGRRRPVASKPKQPAVFQSISDGEVAVWTDADTPPTIYDETTFAEMRRNDLTALTWFIPVERNQSVAETFAAWHAMAQGLAVDSIRLNLHCFGTIKRAAIALFSKWSISSVPHAAPGPAEARWILAAMTGPCIYGRAGWSGPAIQVDVNSHYPDILASQVMYPAGPGAEVTLDKLPAAPSIGFYRCTIEGCPPQLFRVSASNVYTHTDIYRAMKFSAKIKLIVDGHPNAYQYQRSDCLFFSDTYGTWVRILFAEKAAGNAAAKAVLNMIWGLHCERERCVAVSRGGSTTLNIDGDIDVMDRRDDGGWRVKYFPDGRPTFHGEYPRVGPFLLAAGRERMAKIFDCARDKIVRIYNDGVVLAGDTLPADIEKNIGVGLGQLKVEKRGAVTVQNVMNVHWE